MDAHEAGHLGPRRVAGDGHAVEPDAAHAAVLQQGAHVVLLRLRGRRHANVLEAREHQPAEADEFEVPPHGLEDACQEGGGLHEPRDAPKCSTPSSSNSRHMDVTSWVHITHRHKQVDGEGGGATHRRGSRITVTRLTAQKENMPASVPRAFTQQAACTFDGAAEESRARTRSSRPPAPSCAPPWRP